MSCCFTAMNDYRRRKQSKGEVERRADQFGRRRQLSRSMQEWKKAYRNEVISAQYAAIRILKQVVSAWRLLKEKREEKEEIQLE